MNVPEAWVSLAQGSFYVATGLWPLMSLASFVAVTGPKFDGWLVKTVGLLIAVVGGVLVLAALRDAVDLEVASLGIGCAVVLTAIDIYYVSIGRIARVYLFDAGAEAVLVAAWIVALIA